MDLHFRRLLSCKPDVAYALVSDPASMNLWSTAKVVSVSPGDSGHVAGVGALRDVHVPGFFGLSATASTLHEVILVAEPSARFSYKVIGGAPIKAHRGDIVLTPRDGGTELDWRVHIEFAIPFGDAFAARTVVPELEKSIDAMVKVASKANAVSPPTKRSLTVSEDELARLFDNAERVHQALLTLHRETPDHPANWFTCIYAYVTEELLTLARGDQLTHPAWCLDLIDQFYELYMRSMNASLRGEAPEAHWGAAYRAMAGAKDRFPRDMERVGYIVAKGIQAHVEEDLPRALASVYVNRYAGRCDYTRFRGDWWTMLPVISRAGERFRDDHAPRSGWPKRYRFLERVLPQAMQDAYVEKNHYALTKHRRKAFERGERIADMLRKSSIAPR